MTELVLTHRQQSWEYFLPPTSDHPPVNETHDCVTILTATAIETNWPGRGTPLYKLYMCGTKGYGFLTVLVRNSVCTLVYGFKRTFFFFINITEFEVLLLMQTEAIPGWLRSCIRHLYCQFYSSDIALGYRYLGQAAHPRDTRIISSKTHRP